MGKQSGGWFFVRVPAEMRGAIRARAVESRRSINAEIVHYIDLALGAHEAKGAASTAIDPRPISNPTHEG